MITDFVSGTFRFLSLIFVIVIPLQVLAADDSTTHTD